MSAEHSSGRIHARLTDERIEVLVRRIVEAVQPDRVILFGSAVRGDLGPNSDVDVLVVQPEPCRHLAVAQRIHSNLGDFPFAVDVVVNTAAELERYKDSPATVVFPALHEGKVIYDASQIRGG